MTDTAQQPTDDKTPAAGAAAAAGAAGSPPPADNTPPASDAGTAPQAYRPEGLPDHFAGKDDRETIDKLHKAVDGFRKEQGKKGVPETPDGYELALPDDIKQKVLRPGEDGKDALFE
ncbi:MAG: hypothetical protein Q8K65_12195, partial [Alphaproteobacteria bacterium]|nr:hypothetical protein [Alphaproteobacteria bacterium]